MTRLGSFLFQAAQVVVGLCLLELAVRWHWKEELERLEPVVPYGVGRYDARLGWTGRENARASSRRFGEEVGYSTDAYGLRDINAQPEKAPGAFRVLLVGESIAFGFGVPLHAHFSQRLEQAMPGLEVINLAFPAYGIDQMVLRLKEEGRRWHPDLVMALVPDWSSARHMHSTRFGRPKPQFVLEGDALRLTHVPVPRFPPMAAVRWMRGHSAVFSLTVGSLGMMSFSRDIDHENDVGNLADPAFTSQLTRLGHRLLDEMQADSSQLSAPLVLVSREQGLLAHAREVGITAVDIKDLLENPEWQLPNNFRHLNAAGNQALTTRLVPIVSRHQMPPLPQTSTQPSAGRSLQDHAPPYRP